ncbi:MAG: peroxiredoxin [Methylotenera sp.]|nr:peroxiredoxin [Methylotenera sp.]
MNSQFNTLPDELPIPVDDGLAAHLEGTYLPSISFKSTNGHTVDLSHIKHRLVVYIYPLTGRPDVALPVGWDAIPGARGCTPQACDFSNHYQELRALNTVVYGLSSQSTAYQSELKNRLHLPFDLLSDCDFLLRNALNLPTFKVRELALYKRLTIVAELGVINKVFYPVFPPNQNAAQVIDWLKNQ